MGGTGIQSRLLAVLSTTAQPHRPNSALLSPSGFSPADSAWPACCCDTGSPAFARPSSYGMSITAFCTAAAYTVSGAVSLLTPSPLLH